MRRRDLDKEVCSVARAVSVVGDRWTLMLLREAFLGVRRFEQMERRLGISRSVVAERLRGLVAAGVLRREPYQHRPVRHEYRLTEKGLALHPVIMSLVAWGDEWMADDAGPPMLHRHKACGCDFHPVQTCSHCGEPISARDVEVRPGPSLTAVG